MRSWAKYDPKVEIAKTKGSVLIVQGGTDAQVFMKDAERLAEGKPEAKLVVIDDMCHPLKQSTETEAKKQQKQYQDPGVPLHEALGDRVVRPVASSGPSATGSGRAKLLSFACVVR